MEQKRVSFNVAKAIKNAGYPQDYGEDSVYFDEDGNRLEYNVLIDGTEETGRIVSFAPTAEQMIGWLEEKGMFIEVNSHRPDRIIADWKKSLYTFCVVDKFIVIHKHGGYDNTIHYSSRKESTLAAIDVALEYLSKNKK